MLTTINTGLRRRRRRARIVLAILVVGAVAATAHSALMSSSMGDGISDVGVVLCITIGGGLFTAAAAVMSVRWRRLRVRLPLVAVLASALDLARAVPVCVARAGPAPMLQVFRL